MLPHIAPLLNLTTQKATELKAINQPFALLKPRHSKLPIISLNLAKSAAHMHPVCNLIIADTREKAEL